MTLNPKPGIDAVKVPCGYCKPEPGWSCAWHTIEARPEYPEVEVFIHGVHLRVLFSML